MDGLGMALHMLKLAGCGTVYVDGSFVTTKPAPGDFDVCWDVDGVAVELIPPLFFNFDADRAAQKAQFGGEFFPAQLPEGESGVLFLDFFQRDRDGRLKGIVALDLESLP